MIRNQFKNLILVLSLVAVGTGCTKTFVVRPVPSAAFEYGPGSSDARTLGVSDARTEDGKPLNIGTFNVVLEGMPDECAFLGENVARVLKHAGIDVQYETSENPDIKLVVRTYQIRNQRTSGFSPYHTYTRFSADLIVGNAPPQRITSYFKNSKAPIWTFSEIERPCYQIPIEVVVGEVAAKLNRFVFKRVTSDEAVTRLVASIDTVNADASREQYLKVLQLGYTNNPAAIEPLLRLAEHRETLMRASAISALGILGAREHFPLLSNAYRTGNDLIKAIVVKAIADLDTDEGREFVRQVKASSEYRTETVRDVVDLYE